ncbi:hypothetical protein AGMMS49938_01440 [Fibrobacterales bacterium]|nr:hypothetical protein AGMMS49938_01440 [Fibrobacterales bacterium]
MLALQGAVAATPTAAEIADLAAKKNALEAEKLALENDIKKLNEKIQQTDSITKAEQQYGTEQQARQEADIKRRQNEIELLRQKLSELSAEMKREKLTISKSQVRVETVEATKKALSAKLAVHCRNLEKFVANGLPWDIQSRTERISVLCVDLETGTATIEEGFSRLRTIYAEEIRFGDEVQLSNRTMTRNDGEVINASVLRIGNQWVVYIDDAGTRFGVLNKIGENYIWKEDLSFEERQAVKTAIDVKLSRKPPQIVVLPLSLSLNIGGKK